MIVEENKHIDVHMKDKDIQLLTIITEYIDNYNCEQVKCREYWHFNGVSYLEIKEAKRSIHRLFALTSID